jgi:hypothetical protein
MVEWIKVVYIPKKLQTTLRKKTLVLKVYHWIT